MQSTLLSPLWNTVQFTDNVCLWYHPSVLIIHHRETCIVSLEGYETLLFPNKRSLFPCSSFSSFSSELCFNLSKARGEREGGRTHVCGILAKLGDAVAMVTAWSTLFLFFFAHPIISLVSGVTREQKDKSHKEGRWEAKRWSGQKDRRIKDKRGKIRNDKTEEISWCGIATQRKCQAASPLVSCVGAAHRDWQEGRKRCRHTLSTIYQQTKPASQPSQSSPLGQYTRLIPLWNPQLCPVVLLIKSTARAKNKRR